MKALVKHIAFIALLTVPFMGMGQTKLHVLTKTIKREIAAKSISELVINAERADLQISVWEKESIGIIVKLSAKHPEKERAEKELELMKFLNEKIGKSYYLRNYLLVKSGAQKPESNFNATYEIQIPLSMSVKVKDSFGEVKLNGLRAAISLDLNFCETILTNCQAATNIKSYFGSNTLENLSFNLDLNSNRSENKVSKHAGDFKANVIDGSLEYDFVAGKQEIDIEASGAKVVLRVGDLKKAESELVLDKSKLENAHLLTNTEKRGTKITWKNKGSGEFKLILTAGTLTIH